MSFFRNFPLIDYSFNGVNQTVVDLFRNAKLRDTSIDNVTEYLLYEIDDGDRPDNVSYSLYGDTEYHWTFFVINQHLRNGHASWPMSSEQFERYLAGKYDDYTVLNMVQRFDLIDYEGQIPEYPLFSKLLSLEERYNCLNGLPLEGASIVQYLGDTIIAQADVFKFDSNLQQLWIKTSSTSHLFTNIVDFNIIIDPEIFKSWLEKYRQYSLNTAYFNNCTIVNNSGINVLTLTDSIKFARDLTRIPFRPRSICSAREAVAYYAGSDGLKTTNNYLLGDVSFNESNLTTTTNHEKDYNENEINRYIRVVKPEMIREFSQSYFGTINR